MGQIQTNIGLITGVPIQDMVDQLMDLAAINRDRLQTRTEELRKRQVAVGTLGSLIYATKISVNNLGKSGTYDQLKAASSNPDALSVKLDGQPAKGIYEFTPLQMAQSEKLLSTGFKSKSDAIGSNTITVRFGDHVQRGVSLDMINSGAGFVRGKIRIGDRSGAWADVDLSTARSIDDVIEAINGADGVNVTADTRGGQVRLTDNTGQSVTNLQVLEVSGGMTAASLGLAGIDTAANVATGSDIFSLFDDIDLDQLNDGNGVGIDKTLADISYTLRDGTTGRIDFSVDQAGSAYDENDDTIGKIIDRINEETDGKIQAEIAADGRRLQLTDTTTGTEEFTLESLYESQALEDLGLDNAAVDGVITGDVLIGGLRTVALRNLDGGQGIDGLGSVDLTDRSGATATVDLSAAETLEDVVETINTAAVAITARINDAKNGIELVDTSGGTASNLIVADADDTESATRLQIAADTSITSVNSGDLHLQIVSESTRLDDLNGGAGVTRGRFVLKDSTGRERTIRLTSDDIETVGDVIDKINQQYLGVRAELNETGDGILLRDTAGGAESLTVTESGSTTARDLGLLRKAEEVEVDGETQQHIDGSMTYTIVAGGDDSLADFRDKINALDAGFSASTLSDGSTRPWHLTLVSGRAGEAGSLVVDTSQATFDFAQMSTARDSVLAYGPAAYASSAMLVTSSDNKFEDVVDGMSLEMHSATGTTVSVAVTESYATLSASAKSFVDNYNRFRDELERLTRYDTTNNKGAVLTGDSTALRMDTDMTTLVTSRFEVGGRYHSLEEVGITFNETGKLSFNESKFNEALATDPEAVEQLFATEDTGVSARFGELIEQLAGEDNSLLERRMESLDDRIADNEERIERMTASLSNERERLLTQFYNMELAVSRIQTNLNALDSISWITEQNKRSNSKN